MPGEICIDVKQVGIWEFKLFFESNNARQGVGGGPDEGRPVRLSQPDADGFMKARLERLCFDVQSETRIAKYWGPVCWGPAPKSVQHLCGSLHPSRLSDKRIQSMSEFKTNPTLRSPINSLRKLLCGVDV